MKKEHQSIEIKKSDCKLLNLYSYFNQDERNVRFKNFNQILDLNQILIKKRYVDPTKDQKECSETSD